MGYGIYNTVTKQFQFGIDEPTKSRAMKQLFKKIGKDAYKWRFKAKRITTKKKITNNGGKNMDFTKFDQAINGEDMAKQIEEAKNNPQQSDKQVEAGNYTVKIEKMEIAATKDGRPMFKVQCRILDGEFKKWCLFMNRVIYGTKNDANMIASVIGWLEKLEPSVDVEFKNYSQFSELVLDIFEEVADAVELDVAYDPDAFNSISITEVFDAE